MPAAGPHPGRNVVLPTTMSACTPLAMPAADRLFRRVIAQSGAARCVISPDTAAGIGARLAEMALRQGADVDILIGTNGAASPSGQPRTARILSYVKRDLRQHGPSGLGR